MGHKTYTWDNMSHLLPKMSHLNRIPICVPCPMCPIWTGLTPYALSIFTHMGHMGHKNPIDARVRGRIMPIKAIHGRKL